MSTERKTYSRAKPTPTPLTNVGPYATLGHKPTQQMLLLLLLELLQQLLQELLLLLLLLLLPFLLPPAW